MRAILAAIAGCVAGGCSASVAVPAAPAGLTCTAPNGAIVRLNLDLAGRRFQKEGFPSLPIENITARQVVLMHETTSAFIVTAAFDRNAMTYIATSEDKSHTMTETRYACTSGPPFEVAGAN